MKKKVFILKHIKYKFDLLNLALAEIFKHFSLPASASI
ncbi:hypothetical protein LPE509_01230 [Legionella pneumophila subsp. pneumophila LPE509]|nr:hypothetical protein LPE509_01230 [Legionella pneumophila subsp. pneumophila LPE509]